MLAAWPMHRVDTSGLMKFIVSKISGVLGATDKTYEARLTGLLERSRRIFVAGAATILSSNAGQEFGLGFGIIGGGRVAAPARAGRRARLAFAAHGAADRVDMRLHGLGVSLRLHPMPEEGF